MLKVRTLFSGIGSPEIALRNLQIPFELIDFCEVDKYAVQSYCAVHGVSPSKNLGDITKVWGRNLPYADLLVWGFPCTDISVAGKQKGIVEGETRSGLYYEGLRILRETKPKYSVIENVKNLTGKKFKAEFEQMLEDIKELGYNNYWKVLNAKDYGIPQNRERVFIVSIRVDIDGGNFQFPVGFDNGLRLKDFLEDEVEEKFYLSEKMLNGFMKHNEVHKAKGTGFIFKPKEGDEYASCLRANAALCPTDNTIKITLPCIAASRGRNPLNPSDRTPGNYTEQRLEINTTGNSNTLTTVQKDNYVLENKIIKLGELNSSQDGIVHDIDGISQCLSAGHGNTPKVAVKEVTKKGYAEAAVGDSINIQFPNSETRRGRVGIGVAQTLETACNQATLTNDYRIRKLTPKECWRLMGFFDEDFQRAQDAGVSNSQLYKQAGNSIVSNVLAGIFKKLLQAEISQIYEEDKALS